MREKRPILSVIIPVFNTERFLPRALDSVYQNSPKGVEIIVVDDASGGDCRSALADFPHVIYIRHEKNKGLLAARCTGIRAASGQYIVHLDPDDWIINQIYSESLDYAIKMDLDVVIFGIQECNQKNESWLHKSNSLNRQAIISGKDVIARIMMITNAWVWQVGVNKLVRKECYDDPLAFLGALPHLNMFEDLLLSVLLYLNLGDKVGVMPRLGYCYYRHEETLTLTKNSKGCFKRISDAYFVRKVLKNRYGKEWKDIKFLVDTKLLPVVIDSFKLMEFKFILFNFTRYLRLKIYWILRLLSFNEKVKNERLSQHIIRYLKYKSSGLYVFGTGELAQTLAEELKKYDIMLIAFIVSVPEMKSINGIPICGLDAVSNLGADDTIIISSLSSISEIYNLLRDRSNNVNIVSAFGVQQNAVP